ncbi:hypothetical protein PHABIO_401 [Pseudomonas phage Phabio]|uniref:Uncharacterized protein n=1 Tax=Pseudomonas phage Phabio TaxID=2006668 RepID=A0A1Y0SU57_9CAUD|nr:hypothetical protein MZD05_gp401 [Pseudomonas phage Phabio]ARV77032.1 hypothetical protein PHABIO_401 [Pseudomonas phage Phabio]
MGLANMAVDYTVSVNSAGNTYYGHPDHSGVVTNELVLSEQAANVLMNRMVAGYWDPISEGIVINWEINRTTGQHHPVRIIEASVVDQANVIEYIPTNPSNADLAFIIAKDVKGTVSFVSNMFADKPFVTDFSKADLMWFNEPGLDSIIKRGFVHKASEAFMEMYSHNYNIQLMWVRIKE